MITEPAHDAINVVAPGWANNREFTRKLAAVLRRPALMPVPGIAIRALFGDMGNQLILKSQTVRSVRLTKLGFCWLVPTLEGALR